jgi:murein DD-endopeptidase MepM/ murein hydrolase activator NlpD
MRIILRSLVVAVLLVLGYGLLEPYIERAMYTVRLAAMPTPEALPVPVEGVRPRALRDTWGGARSEGRKHEGIDIFAKRGTPVRSATEGIVTRVGTNRLGGLVVWVMGPGGQRHYYAHLERYSDVEAGMRIEPGRVLGYVGNTGNAKGTPPHLHYGIYETGGAINPYPLLRPDAAALTRLEAAATTSARPAAP